MLKHPGKYQKWTDLTENFQCMQPYKFALFVLSNVSTKKLNKRNYANRKCKSK